jgi:hypothetical protein
MRCIRIDGWDRLAAHVAIMVIALWIALGGGSRISKSVPLYLEGTASLSRYDPAFAATGGGQDRRLPTKNGWGFPRSNVAQLGPMAGTQMGIDPNAPKVSRFITSGGEPR